MDVLVKVLGLTLVAATAVGCSAAHIALPAHLAATTVAVPLTGMGYGETGRFQLAGSSGAFTRRALTARETHFPGDGTTANFGGGTFTASGPDFVGTVEANCRHSEVEREFGAVTATVARFRYRCTFARDGRPLDAELRLAAVPRSPGKLLSAATRAGQLVIGVRALALEPIHHATGMRFAAGDPLGYKFVSAGRDVGAVDLNGERKTIFAPASGSDREAVLIGSLALAILWHG